MSDEPPICRVVCGHGNKSRWAKGWGGGGLTKEDV